MTARTVRLALILAICLVAAVPMVAAAAPASAPSAPTWSPTCTTTSGDITGLAGVETGSWAGLPNYPSAFGGPDPDGGGILFTGPTSGGKTLDIIVKAGTPRKYIAGATAWPAQWNWDFTGGDALLYTGNAGGATASAISIRDHNGGLMLAAGANIAPAYLSTLPHFAVFYPKIEIFDANGVSLGSCTPGPLPSGTVPGSAPTPFVGITSTRPFKTAVFSLIAGTNAVQKVDFAIDTFYLSPAAKLTATKTTDTVSYTLEPVWSIAKTVDAPTVVKQVGGSATFNYHVTVAQTGAYKYTAQKVVGKISVTNPNAVPVDVSIKDEVYDSTGTTLEANAQCTVETGAVNGYYVATLPAAPAAASVFNYTCTWVAPGPSSMSQLQNQAKVVWDPTLASALSAPATATVDWTTGAATWKNQTVTVTDGADLSQSTSAATVTYDYSKSWAVPTWGCSKFTNTAKLTGDNSEALGQDTKDVEVCGPMNTGAKDIIFWGAGGGQTIINNACAPLSVGSVSLYRYLRTFKPFQDLVFTKCSDLAKYVAGVEVIGMFPASNNSPNMLAKAQMLATALNVYYSTPVLSGGGGNLIGAPSSIGTRAVDVNWICNGDCKTTTVWDNTALAFYYPGPVPAAPNTLSVNLMLSMAASKSGVGGFVWYQNQALPLAYAYEAFRAVNVKAAFQPWP